MSRWQRFKAYISNDKNAKFVVPITAVLMGFAVGILIMLFTGRNPIDIFTSLIKATVGLDFQNIFDGTGRIFNPRYIGEWFVFSMPIILTGLSIAFAFRTGLFNIGAEGQLMAGSFGAIMVGLLFDLPGIIHLPLAIITGVIFGGLWGFIPGFLKAKFNVHEVVVTIMMNYAALFTFNYLYKQFEGSTNARTVSVPASASLHSDFLSKITNLSRLHWGFILVALAVVAFWIIIDKTTFGFELKAAGFNKHASKYAGMKVNRNIILSMVIAGMFAGLGGVVLAIGTFDYGRVLPAAEGLGFDGIAVALVGGVSAFGSLFSGLLFGALKAAQPLMQAQGIPKDIASIIISAIVIFVAMQSAIKLWLKHFEEKKDENESDDDIVKVKEVEEVK